LLLLSLTLTSCGDHDTDDIKEESSEIISEEVNNNLDNNQNDIMSTDYQTNKPENGDLVAVMKTTN